MFMISSTAVLVKILSVDMKTKTRNPRHALILTSLLSSLGVTLCADADNGIPRKCEDPTMQAPDRWIHALVTKSQYTQAERACAEELNRKLRRQGMEEEYLDKQPDQEFRSTYSPTNVNLNVGDQLGDVNLFNTQAESKNRQEKLNDKAVKTVKGYSSISE